MLNPNVNRLKRENKILKSEIAALKKNFEDFQNSLKLSVNDVNVCNNGGEASRPAISQDETLNTLQFYDKSYDKLRQEYNFRKFFHSLWLSWLIILYTDQKNVGLLGQVTA